VLKVPSVCHERRAKDCEAGLGTSTRWRGEASCAWPRNLNTPRVALRVGILHVPRGSP
jgi:hypothetical protein